MDGRLSKIAAALRIAAKDAKTEEAAAEARRVAGRFWRFKNVVIGFAFHVAEDDGIGRLRWPRRAAGVSGPEGRLDPVVANASP